MSSRYSNGGGAHQRDLRTQLFATPQRSATSSRPSSRSDSPYEKSPAASAKYNEAYLLSLESQNDDEVDTMSQKVTMLKNLGTKMGTEINKSINLNDDITNTMEKGKVTLKNTWNKMIVMSQRAGISWRMWLVVFGVITVFFFWVWLF